MRRARRHRRPLRSAAALGCNAREKSRDPLRAGRRIAKLPMLVSSPVDVRRHQVPGRPYRMLDRRLTELFRWHSFIHVFIVGVKG